MTQKEITNQSNLHKFEYNKCTQYVEDFDKAINSFVDFHNYLSNSKNKVKKICLSTLIVGISSLLLSLIFSFVSLPVAILMSITSIIVFSRCIFFNKILKKFNRCVTYLSKLINNLSTQQLDAVHKRDLEMEEIIKLENTTPNEISKQIALEERPKLEENLDVLSI